MELHGKGFTGTGLQYKDFIT